MWNFLVLLFCLASIRARLRYIPLDQTVKPHLEYPFYKFKLEHFCEKRVPSLRAIKVWNCTFFSHHIPYDGNISLHCPNYDPRLHLQAVVIWYQGDPHLLRRPNRTDLKSYSDKIAIFRIEQEVVKIGYYPGHTFGRAAGMALPPGTVIGNQYKNCTSDGRCGPYPRQFAHIDVEQTDGMDPQKDNLTVRFKYMPDIDRCIKTHYFMCTAPCGRHCEWYRARAYFKFNFDYLPYSASGEKFVHTITLGRFWRGSGSVLYLWLGGGGSDR